MRTPLPCLLLLLSMASAWPMAMGLSLPQAVTEADIIARISVTADSENPPPDKAANPDYYTRKATAKIVTPIKGGNAGDIISINHTNGFACPNVRYEIGRDYLVFLKRPAPDTPFETMNFYAGQFPITDESIPDFYLMTTAAPRPSSYPVDTVVTFLRQYKAP